MDATGHRRNSAFLDLVLAGLAVGLGLAAGCDSECEEAEQHVNDNGWLVMEDVSRTPGGLEDVPGRLTIAASGEMELTFVRGQPTDSGEFGDPPTDYPHTPHRFRYHDREWCGPSDGVGGPIVAMGDTFYSVTAGEDGDLLVSHAIGGRWDGPVSIEVPGVAAGGVVDLAAGADSLAVAFFGDDGIYVTRIDDYQVEEPSLVFETSEQCLFHQLLIDGDRHLHVVATCDRTGARTPTYATDAGGAWQREALPVGGEAIAVSPDGVVHSAATTCLVESCTSYDLVIAYTRRVDGVWSAPVEVVSNFNTEGISRPRSPQIAMLDDGLVVVAFIESHGGGWWGDDTWLRFSRDGGPFGGSVLLQQTKGSHNVFLHQLAVNPATGLPVVMFQQYLPERPSFSMGVAWPATADALP